MGSAESHFYVSLIVKAKVIRLPTDLGFWREMRAEADSNLGPSAYQPDAALALGQTGSVTARQHWADDTQRPEPAQHRLWLLTTGWGAGIAQWLERRTRRDW